MTPEKRARLAAAGYTVTEDVGEVFGFTAADRRVVEFRRNLTRLVRERRSGSGLTPRQTAEIMGVSPTRIIAIANGESSLDALATAIAALGGDPSVNDPLPTVENHL